MVILAVPGGMSTVPVYFCQSWSAGGLIVFGLRRFGPRLWLEDHDL